MVEPEAGGTWQAICAAAVGIVLDLACLEQCFRRPWASRALVEGDAVDAATNCKCGARLSTLW